MAALALGACYATKGAPLPPPAGGCPACPPAYVAQPAGDYWPVEPQNAYTCAGAQGPAGYCNQPSAAAGEGYCSQDSAASAEGLCSGDAACAGYLTTSDVYWAGGELPPGGVLVVKSPPSSTFHRKVAAYTPTNSG